MKLLCAFFLLFVLGASSAAGQTITEFGPAETPLAIALGPDGSLWFTEYWRGANKIGRITVNGEITKFPIPTDASIPSGITAGPDGAIWFTEGRGNHIGRITPSGVITEFPVPGPFIGLNAITTGPDGNLWFTAGGGSGEAPDNAIWRMTPSGTVTRFPLPAPGSAARAITVGSDGNLWFTESNNSIGRITTAAAITEFADVSERSLARLVTVLRERIGDDARNPSSSEPSTASATLFAARSRRPIGGRVSDPGTSIVAYRGEIARSRSPRERTFWDAIRTPPSGSISTAFPADTREWLWPTKSPASKISEAGTARS
jgi:streptogramin lyase